MVNVDGPSKLRGKCRPSFPPCGSSPVPSAWRKTLHPYPPFIETVPCHTHCPCHAQLFRSGSPIPPPSPQICSFSSGKSRRWVRVCNARANCLLGIMRPAHSSPELSAVRCPPHFSPSARRSPFAHQQESRRWYRSIFSSLPERTPARRQRASWLSAPWAGTAETGWAGTCPERHWRKHSS